MSIQNYDKAYASPLRDNYKKLAAAIIHANLNNEDFWLNTKERKAWRSMLFALAETDEAEARKKFEENNSILDSAEGFIRLRQLSSIKGIPIQTLHFWLKKLQLPYELRAMGRGYCTYIPMQTARIILAHYNNGAKQ